MADPALVLLILIGASSADRPHAPLLSTAVSDGLGRSARIVVEERDADPSDEEAASLADGMRGSAVAEIAWGDEQHTRARVHVYLAADRSWYDRELSFEKGDALEERERAIGFLVGAMIRDTEAALTMPPRPPVVVSEPARAPVVRAPEIDAPAPPPPARETASRFAVDVAGLVSTGIDGDAAGLGPSLRGRVVVAGALSLHAGASLGFGSIAGADARMTTTRLVAGGRFRWLTVARDLSFDLGLEALAVNHAVRRDDPIAARDRWLAGAHTDVGVGWRASRLLEPFATVGVDAVLGKTPINVAGVRLAQIPPFRGVAELGVRMHF
jgi:hypothetical protein